MDGHRRLTPKNGTLLATFRSHNIGSDKYDKKTPYLHKVACLGSILD